jgi:hypothetical protein
MYLIKILDSKDGAVLDVNLHDILNCLRKHLSTYIFTLYELDAFGKQSIDFHLGELCEEVNTSQYGKRYQFSEIYKISKDFEQAINLILVGNREKRGNVEFLDSPDWLSKQDVTIQIIDGYCWEIYTANIELLNECKNTFKNVEIVELS